MSCLLITPIQHYIGCIADLVLLMTRGLVSRLMIKVGALENTDPICNEGFKIEGLCGIGRVCAGLLNSIKSVICIDC